MPLLLSDSLRHAEQVFGRKEGVICGRTRLSYAEFAGRCRRLAGGLQRLGVERGDRVAVLMANCHRYLEAYTAIPAIGAVIVPLNTRHTIHELRATLDDSRPHLLITDDRHIQIASDVAGGDTGVALLAAPDDYERLLAESAPATLPTNLPEDALAGLFYTSGMTGAPKGVMLSHRNLVMNAFNMTVGAGFDEPDTFLHTAPMFHLADASSIYALTWRGARHVVLPGFDPAWVLATIEGERVTCTVMVPTMIHAIVNHPGVASSALRSLRLVLHGGAAISTDLLCKAVDTVGCSFTQAYGLTEGSSHIALLPGEERLLEDGRIHSVGRAAMGAEIVVRRADGRACATDEIGEVTVRGPSVTRGYWNRPDETAAAFRDGWFWTGDLGRVDDCGYIYLVDRVKDVIISGGENVYPTEVEQVLGTHPSVQAAAVIGVPDPVWGERVHGVIVPRAGQPIDLDTLRAFCRERIADYKCPRSIETVDALPLSGAGKVLKRVLRDRHRAGSEQQAQ